MFDYRSNLETFVKNRNLRKDEFAAFEQQDVRCREDLKHSHAKAKKLEKTLTQEKSKVRSFLLFFGGWGLEVWCCSFIVLRLRYYYLNVYVKLEEMKLLPEKYEKDIEGMAKKMEKLEKEKDKEDDKLKEVMESLKTETQVNEQCIYNI